LMGGSGVRFKSEVPKQFHRISGKKVYLHTLETFINSGFFEEIVLVCQEEWIDEVKMDLRAYPNAPLKITIGGTTRQESSYQGLLACKKTTEYVVIHDAVRPFVSERILLENIEKAVLYKAVDTCISTADTIVHSKDGNTVHEIPKRSEYLRGQTPQSFHYPLILKAHAANRGKNTSDDCSLVLALNEPIHIVMGDEQNIKITTELDIFIAEQLFRLSPFQEALSSTECLKGKKYIIAGGTGGIGKEVAALLEKEGATAIIASRTASEFGADLKISTNVQTICEKIHAKHGEVDGLINCIGQFQVKGIESLSSAEIEDQIATNLTCLIFCCQMAKIKAEGHIINLSSSSYSKGRKEYPIYSSTKAAVVNFTQALAEEKKSMKINVIVPQRTNTKLRAQQYPNESPEELLDPKDVARAILNLLKSNITGTIRQVRLNHKEKQ